MKKRKDEKINIGDKFSLLFKITFSVFITILFIVVTCITIVVIAPISIPISVLLIGCANVITSIGYAVVFVPK